LAGRVVVAEMVAVVVAVRGGMERIGAVAVVVVAGV